MKKLFLAAVFPAALLAFSGCMPEFDPPDAPESISVFINENEIKSVDIEEGETVRLRAELNPSPRNVLIVWEISNEVSGAEENSVIVSSGEGTECSIRGKTANVSGDSPTRVTVKAWQNPDDTPLRKNVIINVKKPQVRDIVYTGPQRIFVGETRSLSAVLSPAWAGGETISWSSAATAIATVTPNGIIEGKSDGTVPVTITAGAINKTVDIRVIQPQILSDVAIYRDGLDISGGSIEIGLYEEIALSANITPPAADTFLIWESDADAVSVDSNGVIKGLIANETATVTLGAGGFSGPAKTLTVTVKNPVTGVGISYNNTAGLPVTNTIWLAPGDTVELKIDTQGGPPEEINWTVNSGEVRLDPSIDGITCVLTGVSPGIFDLPPSELRITARNSANTGEVSARVPVKVQPPPVWAWDRARDANLNTGLPSSLPAVNNNGLLLHGRGIQSPSGIPFRVFGNAIPYTNSGLKLNSSNNSSGKNPDPIGTPGNSTRIALGNSSPATNAGTPHQPGHQPGVFDFLEAFCEKEGGAYKKDADGKYILKPEMEGTMIRISVDYEIIWSAGAGRDMWIMLNNNNANAAQSELGTASQILIELLTAAPGTRATALTYIDVWDLVTRNISGLYTLEESLICIIALSNGGSIYVSGIRIEYEE